MRRNDLDIIADILRVARDGAKKTRIVYQANLNFNIIKKYLKRMTDLGLIEVSDRLYYSTDKAQIYLNGYDLLRDTIEVPVSEVSAL